MATVYKAGRCEKYNAKANMHMSCSDNVYEWGNLEKRILG